MQGGQDSLRRAVRTAGQTLKGMGMTERKSAEKNQSRSCSPLLQEPMRPGVFRRCPRCGKCFGLKYECSDSHSVTGRVDYYRCSRCRQTIAFAESHPNHVV